MNEESYEDTVENLKKDLEYLIESLKFDFAELICTRLNALGLTPHDLARRMKVSDEFIREVFAGDITPCIDTMVKMSLALGCKINITLKENK